VDVAVVDAATEATLARAGAFGHSARTVEFFRQWGVVDRIRSEWTFPPEWNHGTLLITSLAGHELDGSSHRGFRSRVNAPDSFEQGIRRPQTVLQKVFLEKLAAERVQVSGGWRAVALETDFDEVRVEVQAEAGGERRTIRARYVVGADGSRSTIRALAGIERSGDYATERFFRVVVRTHGDPFDAAGRFPSATNIIVNNTYTGFLAALNSTDWRIHVGPFALDHQPADDEFLAVARSAFGSDVELEVLTATPFFKSTRIADEFRKGRVILVGDAAHVRTPGGNLGEGFGDVFNLGWKLADVVGGTAGPALLDSYGQERRPHNLRVADHALASNVAGQERWQEIRRIGVPDDGDLSAHAQDARTRIGEILSSEREYSLGVTFDERYDDSAAIWYADGQLEREDAWSAHTYRPSGNAGHRAPNGNIDPYGDTLYDRLGSHVALLVLTEDASLVPGFRQAASERGIPVDVIHLPEAAARELYGVDYALIRPDHHVAWSGDAGGGVDFGAVLDRVYGRVPEHGAAAVDELAAPPEGEPYPARPALPVGQSADDRPPPLHPLGELRIVAVGRVELVDGGGGHRRAELDEHRLQQ
jgi:2-polyprenyl-6-methoxyphenol hydroxylase-like FAD-dependent oxidoreductase